MIAAIIWGRARSMMSAAHLSSNLRGKLWGEFFKTAIDILNMSSSTMGQKTRNEKMGKIDYPIMHKNYK